jgi:hypothetical protein
MKESHYENHFTSTILSQWKKNRSVALKSLSHTQIHAAWVYMSLMRATVARTSTNGSRSSLRQRIRPNRMQRKRSPRRRKWRRRVKRSHCSLSTTTQNISSHKLPEVRLQAISEDHTSHGSGGWRAGHVGRCETRKTGRFLQNDQQKPPLQTDLWPN